MMCEKNSLMDKHIYSFIEFGKMKKDGNFQILE
jgi:hypothetical protein